MKRFKPALFWLIAVCTPFLLLEAVSRLVSYPSSYEFIERRLLEQGFRPRKSPGEFRVFMFGESTIHGQYLYPNSTIAEWMKIQLRHVLPPDTARKIRVYNLGRLGEDSFFITRAFLDTLCLKPDLAVFYTSHNDFIQVENRLKNLNRTWKTRVYDGFISLTRKSAFISGLRRQKVRRRLARERSDAPDEISAEGWYDHVRRKHRPNLEKGLLAPRGEQSRAIGKMLENNILQIIRQARKRHVPVIFFGPLARFDAYKPFASVHNPHLTERQLAQWEELHSEAEKLFAQGRPAQALDLYQKASAIDKDYALTWFRIGDCYKAMGRYEPANRCYRMAGDRDHFPIRAPSGVYDFYAQLKDSRLDGVYVIDTQELFEAHAPHGMVDISLVIDQMHPTMRGQALMAEAVCRVMSQNGLLKDHPQWTWDRLPAFELLQKEIPMDDDFRFRALLISALYVGSYYEKAIEFLEQAVAIRPGSVKARSQLAWTYYAAGRLQDAARLYQELEMEAPQEAEAFFAGYPDIAAALAGYR